MEMIGPFLAFRETQPVQWWCFEIGKPTIDVYLAPYTSSTVAGDWQKVEPSEAMYYLFDPVAQQSLALIIENQKLYAIPKLHSQGTSCFSAVYECPRNQNGRIIWQLAHRHASEFAIIPMQYAPLMTENDTLVSLPATNIVISESNDAAREPIIDAEKACELLQPDRCILRRSKISRSKVHDGTLYFWLENNAFHFRVGFLGTVKEGILHEMWDQEVVTKLWELKSQQSGDITIPMQAVFPHLSRSYLGLSRMQQRRIVDDIYASWPLTDAADAKEQLDVCMSIIKYNELSDEVEPEEFKEECYPSGLAYEVSLDPMQKGGKQHRIREMAESFDIDHFTEWFCSFSSAHTYFYAGESPQEMIKIKASIKPFLLSLFAVTARYLGYEHAIIIPEMVGILNRPSDCEAPQPSPEQQVELWRVVTLASQGEPILLAQYAIDILEPLGADLQGIIDPDCYSRPLALTTADNILASISDQFGSTNEEAKDCMITTCKSLLNLIELRLCLHHAEAEEALELCRKLSQLLPDGATLLQALGNITHDERLTLLAVFGHEFISYFANGTRAAECFRKLDHEEEQCLLLTLIYPELPHIIRNVKALSDMLSALLPEVQLSLIGTLPSAMRNIITNGADLMYILAEHSITVGHEFLGYLGQEHHSIQDHQNVATSLGIYLRTLPHASVMSLQHKLAERFSVLQCFLIGKEASRDYVRYVTEHPQVFFSIYIRLCLHMRVSLQRDTVGFLQLPFQAIQLTLAAERLLSVLSGFETMSAKTYHIFADFLDRFLLGEAERALFTKLKDECQPEEAFEAEIFRF